MRTVYGIRGRPGWDVCTALCPCTAQCSACQIASHVAHKGPAPHWPAPNSQLSLPRHGCYSDAYPSVCSDPCAMVLTWYILRLADSEIQPTLFLTFFIRFACAIFRSGGLSTRMIESQQFRVCTLWFACLYS